MHITIDKIRAIDYKLPIPALAKQSSYGLSGDLTAQTRSTTQSTKMMVSNGRVTWSQNRQTLSPLEVQGSLNSMSIVSEKKEKDDSSLDSTIREMNKELVDIIATIGLSPLVNIGSSMNQNFKIPAFQLSKDGSLKEKLNCHLSNIGELHKSLQSFLDSTLVQFNEMEQGLKSELEALMTLQKEKNKTIQKQ